MADWPVTSPFEDRESANYALKVALAMSRKIASAAVVVDARDGNAHRFYTEFGFTAFPETRNRLFIPMKTIEKLFA